MKYGSVGAPPGDLYVVVHVKAHDRFQRDGDDLYLEVPVPYPTMVMGGSFAIDGPAGEMKVDVSSGTASGTLIEFPRKGMPSVTGRGRGSLYVRVVVDVPRKLSKDQKKIVEQLSKTMTAERIEVTSTDTGRDKPFFEKVRDLFD